MTIGDGGKYDDLATMVREIAGAQGVCVIVLNGSRGSGFAQQLETFSFADAADKTQRLAKVLRDVADQLNEDARVLLAKAKA